MKKILLISTILFAFLLIGCDNGSTPKNPEVTFANSSSESWYFNFATYDAVSDLYTEVNSDWVTVASGSSSSSTAFPAGEYYPVFDDDLTDTSLLAALSSYTLEEDKKYLLEFDGSNYEISEQ